MALLEQPSMASLSKLCLPSLCSNFFPFLFLEHVTNSQLSSWSTRHQVACSMPCWMNLSASHQPSHDHVVKQVICTLDIYSFGHRVIQKHHFMWQLHEKFHFDRYGLAIELSKHCHLCMFAWANETIFLHRPIYVLSNHSTIH